MTSASIPELNNVRIAGRGVHDGFAAQIKGSVHITGTPVRFSNPSISRQLALGQNESVDCLAVPEVHASISCLRCPRPRFAQPACFFRLVLSRFVLP